MSTPTPVALVISDIHLSLQKPSCRADKGDWLDVQAEYLSQVEAIARMYGDSSSAVPVVCCGDIFDRWNPPPELIRFALKHLPAGMLAVPGQHDLPNHRSDQMHRSGYGVLLQAGAIKDLSPTKGEPKNNTLFFGFGWDQQIAFPGIPRSNYRKVAIIHRFCWVAGKGYVGAPESCRLPAYRDMLEGFDVAFFGDNHEGFIANVHPNLVVNCGTLIRRKANEIDYQPSVWLLRSDGSVKRIHLNTSQDRFHENAKDERPEIALDMQDFLRRLEALGDEALDFAAMVREHLDSEQIEPQTREIILNALSRQRK